MDLTVIKNTISYQTRQHFGNYFLLEGIDKKRDFFLNVVLSYSIVGPNTKRETLDNYRKIVEGIRTVGKLDLYYIAILNGGKNFNPRRPKRNVDYYQKWCN